MGKDFVIARLFHYNRERLLDILDVCIQRVVIQMFHFYETSMPTAFIVGLLKIMWIVPVYSPIATIQGNIDDQINALQNRRLGPRKEKISNSYINHTKWLTLIFKHRKGYLL